MILQKEKLENAVKESLTVSDLCSKLNISVSGGNYKTIKKYINLYNIDISHFIKGHTIKKRFHEDYGKRKKIRRNFS